MAGRADRGDAERHLLIPGVARDLAVERIEYPAVVVEELGHAALGRAAHLAVVHPELPFAVGHLDLGIRERRRVVGGEQPVHVIGVEVRDHHDIDRIAADAGGCEVVLQPAALAFALRERRLAVAGVDQHALA